MPDEPKTPRPDCPDCGVPNDVHYTHTRYRFRDAFHSLVGRLPYRCHRCSRRFYARPPKTERPPVSPAPG